MKSCSGLESELCVCVFFKKFESEGE